MDPRSTRLHFIRFVSQVSFLSQTKLGFVIARKLLWEQRILRMFTAAEDRKVIISALVLIFWHQHIIEMLEGQWPRTQEGGKVLLNRKRFDA